MKNKQEVRSLLNALFLLGFIAAFIVYFALPHNRTPFLIIAAVSIVIKTADYIIRFFVKEK
ncbi:MAG: hypothetical protein IKH59_00255 [Bacteroidaceae bacterium]|nr:hypothetical protein [Bacteroidaceae bacterium]